MNGAFCSDKEVEVAELGDADDALMRCDQTMPLLVGAHLGGLYTQSVHTPDLHLQDGPPQDTR